MYVNGRPPRAPRPSDPVSKKIRARAAAEHGQSLVIVALAMVAVLGMAALAIDVGTWYEKHHQAQVAADGAALAAANCMANAGSTGDSCTSSTDTSDATTVAETYASDNGVSITSSDIAFNMTKDTVTVTTPNPAPAFFASIVGIHGTTPTASSTATWTSEQASTCTAAEESKGDCYAIFAYDTSCTNPSLQGVFNNSNNTVILGAVHSNGGIDNTGNKNTKFEGPNSYGSGSGCTSNVTAVQDPNPLCYPVDYSGQTPSPSTCGGTNASPAWSPPPTSYCTVTISTSGTYTIPKNTAGYLTPGVYCDTNASGTVAVSGSAQSTSAGVTVIAYNYDLTSAGTLYPYTSSLATAGNQLVLYQYSPNWNGTNCDGSGSSPVIGSMLVNGNTSFNLNGTVFAPCATVTYTANNTTMVGFIEAYNVLLEGASLTGSGPAPTGAGDVINTPGADSLTF
jgi:Putative Flp pilus-assembly TadE/G-like